MDDADLVVQALYEPERDLVLGPAISGDSIPMTLDHLSELLVRRQPLPLEARAPVLEEAPRPALTLVTPQLAEGLLEQIGRIEALVRCQQGLQCLPAIEVQVLAVRQQGVLLSLDIAPVFAGQPGVLALAHLIERLAQVTHDMELVEQDRRLRHLVVGHRAKRFPHVHRRQADAFGPGFAEPIVELHHARLRPIHTAEPDRSTPNEVTDHDAVGMPFADRDLIDADGLGARRAHAGQLHAHVLLVQFLDRMPVQMQFLGDRLDRGAGAASTDVIGEPLRVQRIVGQEVQALALHGSATPTVHPPHFDLEIDARVGTGQIAHPARAAVVPAHMRFAADTAECFFGRRTSVMTRAMGSPKTPRTMDSGRKPGNRYASRRRFDLDQVGIGISCQVSAPAHRHLASIFTGSGCTTGAIFSHTISR